jgi:hypothetical protein
MDVVELLDIERWQCAVEPETVARSEAALEEGRVLFAPRLRFELSATERHFLSADYLDGISKNINLRPGSCVVGGVRCKGAERYELRQMLERYCNLASGLVKALVPGYAAQMGTGYTSYRPVEVAGRVTSWQRDDTRLHVDAFPTQPVRGWQILRVFSNIHPSKPRIWRVGEAFEDIAARFVPLVRPPLPGSSLALFLSRRVRGLRSEYDHFMLRIHDEMKADARYQAEGPWTEVVFPPDSTWACFTDRVPHAAMSGQFALEQTFYVPVEVMRDPERTPLRVIQRLKGRRLVHSARNPA